MRTERRNSPYHQFCGQFHETPQGLSTARQSTAAVHDSRAHPSRPAALDLVGPCPNALVSPDASRCDGLLVLTLRKPYADGTTDFVFSEVELAQKLAALVPPKGKNGISYPGVFGPRHRFRNEVIPEPPKPERRARLTKTPGLIPSRWHGWADLLWRVFEVDGLACECGGRLTLHAVVCPPATLDVLESLERSANRQARGPPQAEEGTA